jgi:TonB family protein
MPHHHSLRYCLLIVIAGALSALWPSWASAESDLERHLRDQYDGKTLVLRNFYHGERLNYNSAGSPANGSFVSGDWTIDGFVRVKSLGQHGQRLTIQAERVIVGNNGTAFQFQQHLDKNQDIDKKAQEKAERERKLRIEVEFDASEITSENADAALSKIFLTAQDHFAELVPDYWKPCVLAASTGRGIQQYKACSFPSDFAAIPGIVYSLDEAQKPDEASTGQGPERLVGHIGKGVTPPKVIVQKDPEFSESARIAKYQGTVMLALVVDKTGQVRKIRVQRPLGFGLDQKAVETVSGWKFKPAARDGEPVDVEIMVETTFRLY